MDSYFCSAGGSDEFSGFGEEVPASAASSGQLDQTTHQEISALLGGSDDATAQQTPPVEVGSGSFDYFGSTSGEDDPFSFAAPPSTAVATHQQPHALHAETISDIDLGGGSSPVVSSPTNVQPSLSAAAPVSVASSMSSYFGDDADAASDAFAFVDNHAAPAADASNAQATENGGGIGYFDEVPADDWMNAGDQHQQQHSAPQLHLPQHQQPSTYQAQPSQSQIQPVAPALYASSPGLSVSPFSVPSMSSTPALVPTPALTATPALAPTPALTPAPVATPPVHTQTPSLPTMPSIAATSAPMPAPISQQTAPVPQALQAQPPAQVPAQHPAQQVAQADPFAADSSSSNDYFQSGGDDWLGGAAADPLETFPTQTQPPSQQPQQHASQYAPTPSFQSEAHVHPPVHLPQLQTGSQHAHAPHAFGAPPAADRQVSDQLRDIDLNAPPTPKSSAPTTLDAARPPPPQQAHFPTEPPQVQPYGSAFANQLPPTPQTQQQQHPAHTQQIGGGVYQPNGVPHQSAHPYPTPSSYGSELQARHPMPPPQQQQQPPPHHSQSQPQPPTPFMPRPPMPDPSAHAPQHGQPSTQARAPWQPQPQQPQQPIQPPQPNGHPSHAPQQNPSLPPTQHPTHPPQQGAPATTHDPFAQANTFSGFSQPPAAAMRSWSPPPAHPLVCFGFGGRLLTMIPRGPQRPGSIEVQPLGEVLASQSFFRRLETFPGPLTMPASSSATTRHPRHADIERLVHQWTDEASNASLPSDSPLRALGAEAAAANGPAAGAQVEEEAVGQHRASERLLHTFLLEALRHAGRIHRAANPAALTTHPAPQTAPGASGEELGLEASIVSHLLQTDVPASPTAGTEQWLGAAANAASTQGQSFSAALVPSPVRVASSGSSAAAALDLVEERTSQEAALVALQALLLRGQRREACALAVEHGLWAHALLLASFDATVYHGVVGRFASSSLADGSPLQTLYLLLAHQPGALFRGVPGPDGKGIDGLPVPGPHSALLASPSTPPLLRRWRASLAVLLANPTPGDKQVLTTLADALWSNHRLPSAAHAVYMLAGHGLGPDIVGAPTCAMPAGRVLLLGADHRRHARTFARDPAAIQRTEVFEYARQLAAAATPATSAPAPSNANGQQQAVAAASPSSFGGLSPSFQLFKLVYAYQLAEVGLLARSLQYCEQLTQTLATHGRGGSGGRGTLVYPVAFLASLESLEARLRESLNKAAAGPGVAKKIVSKLFNWMVGDSAAKQSPTNVDKLATPSASSHSPSLPPVQVPQQQLPRSVSSGALPSARTSPALNGHGSFGASTGLNGPIHGSASEFNLSHAHAQGQVQQNHHATQQGPQSHPLHQQAHTLAGAHGHAAPHTNGGLHPPTHTRAVTEPHASERSPLSAAPPAPAPSPVASDGVVADPAPKKGGLFGSLVGSLWSKATGGSGASKPKEIPESFRDQNSFEFDDALGRWVQRDAQGRIVEEEEKEPEKPIPPPDMSKIAPPLPPPSSSAGPGLPPPPSSRFASRGGGTKNRYALADASYEDADAMGATRATLPTPALPAAFPSPVDAQTAPPQMQPMQPAQVQRAPQQFNAYQPQPPANGAYGVPAPMQPTQQMQPPQAQYSQAQAFGQQQPPSQQPQQPYGYPSPSFQGQAQAPPPMLPPSAVRPGMYQPPAAAAPYGQPQAHPSQAAYRPPMAF